MEKKENKSFLRRKWESFFLQIVKKRISTKSYEKKEILILDSMDELKRLFNKTPIDRDIKLVIISIPLNNFENLVEFFYKINRFFPDKTWHN